MPQFELNSGPRRHRNAKPHPFYSLNTFARGYVEAMFFTNCDCGLEEEFIANRLGVQRLTNDSVARIADDCRRFEKEAARLLLKAYARDDYSEEQAGRDFWFTRQGHGVGFWDRKQLDDGHLGVYLSDAANKFGEHDVEIYRGWIRY